MEDHEESARIDNIPPLIMNAEKFDNTIQAIFDERFGGYDGADLRRVNLRRKLRASALTSDTDESMVVVHGEVAQVLRQWLDEHKR